MQCGDRHSQRAQHTKCTTLLVYLFLLIIKAYQKSMGKSSRVSHLFCAMKNFSSRRTLSSKSMTPFFVDMSPLRLYTIASQQLLSGTISRTELMKKIYQKYKQCKCC